MELVKAISVDKSLKMFFDTMFGGQRGYIYSPLKEWSAERTWKTYFFKWPEQKDALIEHALSNAETHDVYYAPALLTAPEVPKLEKPELFAGSYWVWAEFDYGIPNGETLRKFTLPDANVKVRTSEKGHEHWYWRIDGWQQDPEALKDITQRLAYALEADVCFDWGRVLRVPYTIHHESKLSVELLVMSAGTNSYKAFDNLPLVEHTPIDTIDIGAIPEVHKTVLRYKFPEDTADLFLKRKDQLEPRDNKPGSRSSALMRMGYDCAEMGMSNEEIFAVLQNLDYRWAKYSWGRPKPGMPPPADDRQIKNLLKIINIVRVTHPLTLPGSLDEEYPVMGIVSLTKADIHIEWVIPDLIHKEGLFLITGASESGKSQLAIWMLMHIAIGKSVFNVWSAGPPQKVMFVSMEMSYAELSEVVESMLENFTEEEKELMDKNFKAMPLGFAIQLDNKRNQDIINMKIDEHQPIGIVFDSLGIAIGDDIKDQKVINDTFAYLKKSLNRDRGCFVGFIHHNVKAQAGNRKPNKKEDIYGSSYIVNHVRTIIGLWRTGKSAFSDIEVDCLKLSLRPNFPGFRIRRTQPHLGFELVGKGTGIDTEVSEKDFEQYANFGLDDDNGDNSSTFDLA